MRCRRHGELAQKGAPPSPPILVPCAAGAARGVLPIREQRLHAPIAEGAGPSAPQDVDNAGAWLPTTGAGDRDVERCVLAPVLRERHGRSVPRQHTHTCGWGRSLGAQAPPAIPRCNSGVAARRTRPPCRPRRRIAPTLLASLASVSGGLKPHGVTAIAALADPMPNLSALDAQPRSPWCSKAKASTSQQQLRMLSSATPRLSGGHRALLPDPGPCYKHAGNRKPNPIPEAKATTDNQRPTRVLHTDRCSTSEPSDPFKHPQITNSGDSPRGMGSVQMQAFCGEHSSVR